jgi:exopolysaccharide production protein ExoQ
LMYCIAAILFVRDTHRMRVAVLASWPLWTLGMLAVSSAIWSVDPQMTLRRSAALVGTTLLGVYVGSTVSNEVLRRGLRIAIWITVVGSAALILAAPDLGIHYDLHDGYWRGAFLHKNTLGEFASLAVVCFMLDCVARRKLAVAPLVGIGLCVWLLVGAGSRTAWVMTPILAALVIAFARWEASKVLKGVALVAVLIAFVSPSVDWSFVGSLLERDESLTGRIPLWTLVWTDIVERPFLGYGYGAYWLNKAGVARLFWTSLGWADSPQHAHNGFLDVWLECGLGGVLALVAVGVVFLKAPTSSNAVERAAEWSLLALVIAFGCVGGELVIQNSVYWFLVTAVVTQRCLRVAAPQGQPVRRRRLVQHVGIPSTRESVASAGP